MFEQRAAGPELMDGPHFGLQDVVDTFRFIEPVNRWLGGKGTILSFFQRESRAWDRAQSYRLLDVGCGSGDIPLALALWGRRNDYRLQIEAIDRHPLTVELARRRCQGYPEIVLACRDIFEPDGQKYDYVLASMFLHHFPDESIPGVLRSLLAVCSRKVVINDLLRDPLAYSGTWLFTLLTSAVSRHDARLSVKKGFTLREMDRLLRDNAFHGFRLESHFFYRFLLIVDKEASS